MISKFLLAAFLGTSFLGNIAFSSDDFYQEDKHSLTLTSKQLKAGYEATTTGGFLELTDGSKWSVTNACTWGTPNFEMAYHLFDDNYGYPINIEGYNWEKKGVFNFSYHDCVPMLRWNEETQQLEEDPNAPPGGFEVFNLNVQRIPQVSQNNGENKIVINNGNSTLAPSYAPITSFINLTPEVSSSLTIKTSSQLNDTNTNIIDDFPYKAPHAKKFYSWQDPKTQLWFCVERLANLKINSFWKQKIAYSTQFLFGKSQQEEDQRVMRMSEEEVNLFHQHNLEWQQAMGNYHGGTSSLYSTQYQDVLNLTSLFCSLPLDEEFQTLLQEKGPEFPSHAASYLDAFRAFQYNLNKPSHAWVAYIGVPSLEMNCPLYKKEKPSTTKVLMAKTFCLSDNLYSAMGIFKDPLGEDPSYSALSMKLQKYVARIIKESLNPNISHLSFRPLTKMGEILAKSNVPFSSSWGNEKCVTHPENAYIRIKNNRFELYDPHTQTVYRITDNHWFETHPFSGGVSMENIQAYPFITVNINDLLK